MKKQTDTVVCSRETQMVMETQESLKQVVEREQGGIEGTRKGNLDESVPLKET